MSVSSPTINTQTALMYVKQRTLPAGQSDPGSEPSASTTSSRIDPTGSPQIASFLAALTQLAAGQANDGLAGTGPAAAPPATTSSPTDDIQTLLGELSQSSQGSASGRVQSTSGGQPSGPTAKPTHHHSGHHAHAASSDRPQVASTSLPDATTVPTTDPAGADSAANAASSG